MTGRAWRIPALLVIPLLLVAAILVQRERSADRSAAPVSEIAIGDLVATVADTESLSSTWYCAAGTSTGAADGFAEQTVVVANASDTEVTGFVTAMAETAKSVAKPITVPANGRTSVRASDVLKAPWVSLLIEVDGGGVSVVHELEGPLGRSVSGCASSPSSTWYFPAGSTLAGDRNVIAVFNPFPGEATVDVSFDTEDGARNPQQLQGMVVPGGRVVIVDVSAVVTLRERVATTVSARVGRVVAEQVQGSEGREGRDHGLSAVLGATAASEIWTFPVSAPTSMTFGESVALFNPGDADSDVEVQVVLDAQGSAGGVEPFRATVPAHRAVVVDLDADFRIPRSVGRWMIVRTTDGGSVVAERWLGAPRTANGGGLALSMGVPVGATNWYGTLGVIPEATAGSLVIVNPSPTEVVTIDLRLHTRGRTVDVIAQTNVRIAPGGRVAIDTEQLLIGRTDASLEVLADGVVVVGQSLVTGGPADLSTWTSFPETGTETLLTDVVDPASMPDPSSFAGVTTTTSSTTTTSTTTTTVAAEAGPVALPGT